MDIESDIEFLFHRCVCQFAFHRDESERFPAKNEDRSCGSVLTDNPRKHERQTHRLFQDSAIALKLGPRP
jgi:hypothetical protein